MSADANAAANSIIPFQLGSSDAWAKKYQLKSKNGEAIDKSIDDSYRRVARALAAVERPELRERFEREFYEAIAAGAIPAGRIFSNAGAGEQKRNVSLINCTVSRTVRDSMRGIVDGLHDAGLTLAAGCGIGYEFSTLRPRGAFVSGVGATTSGPLSFMDIYDRMCATVASAGGRRGAQMATFDISHPDVADFIRAKREDGRLRQFNLSCLITDEFMSAVEDDATWDLVFPAMSGEPDYEGAKFVWREWTDIHDYMERDGDLVKCRVYATVPARDLWDTIMRSTYDFSEPGFILIDAVNRQNPLHFIEKIRATNPCGEQPLPPFGACLLGSINLTRFVDRPLTQYSSFNFAKFARIVAVFTRMLDNVVELSGLPLDEQREEILAKRRHGMGFFGLGSTLALLGVRYSSQEGRDLAARIAQTMVVNGWEIGVQLANEKGTAPILDSAHSRHAFVNSPYMERVLPDSLRTAVKAYGCRFTHHSSIAPTGTISLALGNNCSNGIEPTFAHEYVRNMIEEGKNTKRDYTMYSYEALVWRSMHGDEPYPDYFETADDIAPRDHVLMQAAVQPWIDSAISKTINVPTDYPFEDFKDIYKFAWKMGLKGCTTFRFNPAVFQGVLVRKEDLANTTYRFTLDDGSIVEARGDQQIEYEGQTQTAANLFDAIKENYFGKH